MFLKKFFAIFQFLQKIFNQNFKQTTYSLLIIFIGFILGNLIGIVKNTLIINNIFILVIIAIVEFVSFQKYFNFKENYSIELQSTFKPKSFFIFGFPENSTLKQKSNFVQFSDKYLRVGINFINSLKRGFLIGVFVEAFKVGS